MGMFNYVFWDGKLNGPMPKKQTLDTAFQTKSLFPCNMDVYYVSDFYGTMYVVPWSVDWELGSESGHRPDLKWFREHVKEFAPANPHRAMSFYTTIGGKWVEYIAGFEHGERMFCYLVNYDGNRFCDLSKPDGESWAE